MGCLVNESKDEVTEGILTSREIYRTVRDDERFSINPNLDEIEDILHYYSYENLDDFVQEISPATIERKADGTLDRESPNYIVEWQLIAEMLFETEALYRHLVPGKIWNEYEMAAAYIRKTIGQEEENEED